ncbi:Growth-regulating factor 6, partial [Cucurbita argyrosperma subsp. sororia]
MSGGRNRLPFTGFHSLQLSGKSWSTKPSSSSTWPPASLSHPICSSPSTQPLSTLLSFPPSFPTNMHVGWNYLQMGYGRKIDPKPRRCRRTDGKKWRCSKEAFQASKYYERHAPR